MSHFSTWVLIEDGAEVEPRVTELLAPYDGEWFADGSRWDWWQLGGRWTGSLDGYDPETDPANTETCLICGGTGRRADAERFEAESPGWIEWSGGCNGCQGKGIAQSWPTQWADHDGDVQDVAYVLERLREPVPEVKQRLALVSGFKERHDAWDALSEDERQTYKRSLGPPTALVTPDGKWHEQARMGWFGAKISDEQGGEEKPEALWQAAVVALLEQHPGHRVAVVDCHV